MSLQQLLDNELIHRLTVRQKIWGGFGLMLVIMAVVSSIPLLTFSDVQRKVSHVNTEVRGATAATELLARAINSASARLGFYLLSEEKNHYVEYQKTIETIDSSLEELKNSASIEDNDEAAALVKEIEADLAQFKKLGAQAAQLVGNPAKNLTGLAYAQSNLTPMAQEMLQIMTEMLITESEESAGAQRKKFLMDLNDLRYNWANLLVQLRGYLILGAEDNLTAIRDIIDTTGAIIKRVGAHEKIMTFDQQDGYQRLVELRATFVTNIEGLVQINRGGKRRVDAFTVREEIGPLMDRVFKKLDLLLEMQSGETNSVTQSVNSRLNTVVVFIVSLFVIGIVAAGLVAWVIETLVTQPLQRAVGAMSNIAQGEGDLTQRLTAKGKDEVAQLATSFNLFSEKIQSLIGRVSKFTDELSTTARDTARVTESTRDGARLQQQETDQVASAMNQMMATMSEVARNAGDAAESTRKADAETAAGRDVVDKTVTSIRNLASDIEQASKLVHELGADTTNIGSVLDVIKNVADQTNLLALNAAIEAARAGEHGRGFAVVADEVRTLASRTQQSAQEINAMIDRVQRRAREAVAAMDKSRAAAGDTVEQASRADHSLDAIAGAVATINSMNTQIATAMHEQSTVAEDINKHIVNISRVSDQTTVDAQKTAQSTERLSGLSVELQSLLKQFKV